MNGPPKTVPMELFLPSAALLGWGSQSVRAGAGVTQKKMWGTAEVGAGVGSGARAGHQGPAFSVPKDLGNAGFLRS